MHPVLFTIPFINQPIHTYGVMIVTGFLCAMYIASHEARRHDPELGEDVLDFAFWALLGGLVGARVLFMLTKFDEYMADPIKFLKVWEGGLVFYGAAAGGMLAFWAYARSKKYDFHTSMLMADSIVVGLPLAHAFGRFGCIAAGCCWGAGRYTIDAANNVVQNFPIAAKFPEGALAYGSLLRHADGTVAEIMRSTHETLPLFPAQIIESFSVACICLILLFVRSRKYFHGQVIITYIMLYGAYRFTIEFFRGDEARGIAGGLSTSQIFTIIMLCAAAIMFWRVRQHQRKDAGLA